MELAPRKRSAARLIMPLSPGAGLVVPQPPGAHHFMRDEGVPTAENRESERQIPAHRRPAYGGAGVNVPRPSAPAASGGMIRRVKAAHDADHGAAASRS